MQKPISTEITETNISQILDILADTPARLESLRARLSGAQFLTPLKTGERSLTENLAHLLHCEAVNVEFIYLALMREGHPFSGIHPERDFGNLVHYELFPFDSLLDYFKFRRTVLLRVLSTLTLGQWSLSLPEKGKKRAESVFGRARSMSLHEMEHIAEIEALIQP
ncbi:MAG: DinB family protein [Chloroflexi bacterium]|nr:DinB family protein [Chloroflexota bacterium]